MQKWFRTYVCSLRKDIVILLIIDIGLLLFMELVLRRIPAPYPSFIKIGDAFSAIGIALLASIIFYFIQIHLPSIKQKRDLYPVIAALFIRIMNEEKLLLSTLLGTKMEEMSVENITKNARNINMYSKAPLVFAEFGGDRVSNLIEYCLVEVKRIDNNWDMLMRYSIYMDSEGLALLSKIHSPARFLHFVRTVFPICIKTGKPFSLGSGIETLLIDFWDSIKEQEYYYNKVLRDSLV